MSIFQILAAKINGFLRRMLGRLDRRLTVKKKKENWEKPKTVKGYMKGKLLIAGGLLTTAFLVLILVVSYQSLVDTNAANKNINNNYNYSNTVIPAARGDILDTNGDILATSIPTYILIVEPKTILSSNNYKVPALMVFKNILQMSEETFLTEISSDSKKDSLYLRYGETGVKTKVSVDMVEKIEELQSKLRSSKVSEKRAAVLELFQLTEEDFNGILNDIAEQKGVGGSWFDRLLAKFQDNTVEVDYAAIGKKYGRTADEIKAIGNWRQQRIAGIWFESEYERVYPNDTLACKILGLYSPYYPEGSMGLEKYYDLQLTGTDGSRVGHLTSQYNMDYTYVDAVKGNTLVTTVDMQIQRIIEEQIAIFMDEIGAENVGVICMDPYTGSVLALADDAIYNPNAPTELSRYYTEEKLEEIWDKLLESRGQTENEFYESWKEKLEKEYLTDDERKNLKEAEIVNAIYRNFCISDTYEPGSTFKPLTISMAYEEGLVDENHTFICDGYELIGGYRIKCHVNEGHGLLELRQALTESCNDYLMHVVSMVGREDFYSYRCQFRIGFLTGIDLPGEVSAGALNYSLDRLNTVELATSSFGQGFNVTMIQMASAISAVINGGYYYTPHFVKEIRDENGMVIAKPSAEPVTQIISSKTSEFIREALLDTVAEGTASYVKIGGYELGGKTGTAQKGERDSGNYVISLVSFAPDEKEEVLLYVVVDQPHLEDQDSSKWAQILSKRIWMELLPYLNIHSNLEWNDYIDPGESGDDPDIPSDGYGPGGYIEPAASN